MNESKKPATIYHYGAIARCVPYFGALALIGIPLVITWLWGAPWFDSAHWVWYAIAILGLSFLLAADLRSPKELVIDGRLLHVRWRTREEVLDLSDTSFIEERTSGYPWRQVRLWSGGKTLKISAALVGYDRFRVELARHSHRARAVGWDQNRGDPWSG